MDGTGLAMIASGVVVGIAAAFTGLGRRISFSPSALIPGIHRAESSGYVISCDPDHRGLGALCP